MIEEGGLGLAAAGRGIQETKRKFPGVVTGRVVNVADPLMLGRVQVQLAFIDALDLAPWARVAVPMAGRLCGHYFIPGIGDEVLVAFEQGDTAAPYVIGALWNATSPPPQQSPLPQIRCVRTLTGSQVVWEEMPPAVTIQSGPTSPQPMPAPGSPVGPHSTVRVAADGIDGTSGLTIRFRVGAASVEMTPAGVSLSVGVSRIDITAAGITLNAPSVQVSGSTSVAVSAPMVRINS